MEKMILLKDLKF